MYEIRELLVALIFAAVAFAALYIPFVILSCLYSAGQSWSARNAEPLLSASTATSTSANISS